MSELPAGWGSATLGDLTASTRPICYGVLKPGPFVPGGVPLLKIQDLAGNVILRDRIQLISEDLDREFERSRLEGGEVLLSIQGTIGRTAVVPSEFRGANVSRTLAVVAPDERLNRRFLYYYFQHLALQGAYETGGSTRASLNIGVIRSMSVPLPGLAEQERIVAALEEHLSRLEAAVSSLGLARRRFGSLVWGPAEAQWRSGSAPQPLSDIGEIVTGSTPSTKEPRYWGNSFPFATPGDLVHGGSISETGRHLSDLGRAQARELPAGAILVTCIGATLGKTALATVPSACNQQINALMVDPAVAEARFVLAMLASPTGQRRLWDSSSSTTLPILNKSRFGRIVMPLPTLEEQRLALKSHDRSGELVLSLGREITRSERRAASLRRGILAAAFAGQLVPQDPDDEPAAVLLERIATERAAAPPMKRQRKVTAS